MTFVPFRDGRLARASRYWLLGAAFTVHLPMRRPKSELAGRNPEDSRPGEASETRHTPVGLLWTRQPILAIHDLPRSFENVQRVSELAQTRHAPSALRDRLVWTLLFSLCTNLRHLLFTLDKAAASPV